MQSFKKPILSLMALLILGLGLNFGFNAFIQLQAKFIIINMILAMSLNLVNGYTGQFSLGHAGFMAIGAYVAAYLAMNWNFLPPELSILSYLLFVLVGGLVAAFAGFLVGKPSLRLRGDYLAIVTLGFSEIIRVALLNMDFLGGARGLAGIPGLNSFYLDFVFSSLWLVFCFFALWRLIKSSHGRGLLAVKEDEIAAEAMGIDTAFMKVKAFVVSSFFAGVAGGLYAYFVQFISPGSFTFLHSVNVVIMVVLGGMGSMTGSLVAAAIITILPEALRPLQEITGVDLRMVIYSLSLIILMILRPKGLFGELELPEVWRKYVRRSA